MGSTCFAQNKKKKKRKRDYSITRNVQYLNTLKNGELFQIEWTLI
jgi:hypothetical protein